MEGLFAHGRWTLGFHHCRQRFDNWQLSHSMLKKQSHDSRALVFYPSSRSTLFFFAAVHAIRPKQEQNGPRLPRAPTSSMARLP